MTAEANEAKIVQIIPATGWYAILDEGTKDEWRYPLVCWALMSTGEVVGQIALELGVDSAELGCDFRYWHEKSQPVADPPPTAEELAAEERKYAQITREMQG